MKEMLQRNLGYKLISLVLAILFWLWVTSQGNGQTLDRNQPLTLSLVTKNIPVNSMIMTKLPSVKVKLEGYNPSVNINELYAYVDLSGSEPGVHDYEVKMAPIPNITIVEISPKVVTLQLDTIEERTLPVTVEVADTPAAGKKAGEPIVRPNVVNVRGPSSLLNSVDKVLVQLSVAGASETVQVSRPLLFRDQNGQPIFGPDPSVETITSSPSSVDIIVPIVAKELESKMIPLKAGTLTGNPAEGMEVRSVQVVPGGVQVFGEAEALKSFEVLNLGPVNINGIAESKTFEITSDKVTLPEGISFDSRKTFSVIVEMGKAIQHKTFYDLPITLKNLPDELVLEKPLPAISVTVKAYPEILDQLAKEQINLWIDAAGKAPGEHAGKIFWQLPAGVEMVSVPDITYILKTKEAPSDQPETPGSPGTPGNKPAE